MGETVQTLRPHRGWRRRAIVAIGLFCLLLLILHRPLLLFVGKRLAVHFAANENLRIDFRIKGNVFTNLTATNIHVISTGASPVESIDADLAQVDYSLLDLIRGRKADFLRNVQLRSVKVVLNPTHELHRPHPKRPNEHATLFWVFPERVKLSNATLIIRNQPHDFAVEHVDLELDPRAPGELRIDKLQLPAGQTWSSLDAKTSYAKKNLVVHDLALNGQDRIASFNVDASRIDAHQLAINLEGKIGEVSISGVTTLRETNSSVNATINLQAKKVAADALNKYVGLPEGFASGSIEDVALEGSGDVDAPRTWNGHVTARIEDFRAGGFHFDHCSIQALAQNGAVTLQTANIVQGTNEFHVQGAANLPGKLNELGHAPATLELSAKGLDLEQFTSAMTQKLSGVAEVNGKVEINNGTLTASFQLSAGPVKFPNGSLEKGGLNFTATKVLPPPANRKTWFADLKTKIDLDISNIHLRDQELDSVVGSISSAEGLLHIDQMEIRRKQSNFTLRGQYNLPENPKELSRTGEIECALNIPELGDLWAKDSVDKWNGPLQGGGQIKWKDGVGNGALSIWGANIRTRGLELKQLNGQLAMANNVVYLNDASANLNEDDFFHANGIVDLWGKHHYTGALVTRISDLSRLQPLLHAVGNENSLAGSLKIDWSGGGDAVKFQNSGKLTLALENGRYGGLKSLQANIDTSYSPDALEIPTIFLRSDRMDFQAIVQARGETLEITKIQLDQGQAKYASGYVSVPFVWKNLGTDEPVIPKTGNVIANFESENIDIKKLFEDFGLTAIASGTLNVKFDAQGGISDPNAHLEVEMRDLRSEKLPSLEPAAFHLTAQTQHDQVAISGKLEQAKVQPIVLTANFPFNLPQIAREGKLPDDTPLKASLKMPRSSVNFVREFVPAVVEVDGDAAIDIDLGGTFAQPLFKGLADMTLNVARASDPTLPALQNFKARLTFVNNVLNFEQFGGELSGGHFNLAGRISFSKLTAADVDVAFKADSALIARSDALTVRSDADIQFKGPISAVNVTGTIALTNSHFLKNLDLIPISLPGRPAPEPPSSHPRIVLPPALRDWKFEVAIKTKDPVLIRGNLAVGGATADLHFSGTGLRPGLNGSVKLENVEATLPFSRLEIAYGFLYFNPDDSLNPKMDLHGTSVIQDYTIHVYIYGTSLSPEAVFNSEPPLPQEDIISLLSTGTTREQLSGNNNALAGRAAMLLVQQLYRKVFKKGQATQSNSVFDRFDLDVGTVDPRTGQQQATARFKINNQFVLVGDVGVSGDYKGMVKYLIRFH